MSDVDWKAVSLADRPIPLEVAAPLMEAPIEEALELGDRPVGEGLLATSGDSFIPASADNVSRVTAALTSVHVAYLHRELGRAFTAAGIWPSGYEPDVYASNSDEGRRLTMLYVRPTRNSWRRQCR